MRAETRSSSATGVAGGAARDGAILLSWPERLSATLEELARVPDGVHEAEFYTLASLAERRLGLWADSLRDGTKAIELDPNNVGMITSLMQTTTGVRRFDETIRQADAAVLRLPAERQGRIWILKQEALLGKGDLPAAEAALQKMTPKDGMDYQVPELWLLFMKRDFSGAQALMERASEEEQNPPGILASRPDRRRAVGRHREGRGIFPESQPADAHPPADPA